MAPWLRLSLSAPDTKIETGTLSPTFHRKLFLLVLVAPFGLLPWSEYGLGSRGGSVDTGVERWEMEEEDPCAVLGHLEALKESQDSSRGTLLGSHGRVQPPCSLPSCLTMGSPSPTMIATTMM